MLLYYLAGFPEDKKAGPDPRLPLSGAGGTVRIMNVPVIRILEVLAAHPAAQTAQNRTELMCFIL